MVRSVLRSVRRWWWERSRVTSEKDISIGRGCQLLTGDDGQIVLGARLSMADSVILNASHDGLIVIGEDCLIGPRVYARTSNHRTDNTDKSIRMQGHTSGMIAVGDDVWIGAGVILLPNVMIGPHSVIGAGSVVTRSIPPWSVAAGNPCRVIRDRREE